MNIVLNIDDVVEDSKLNRQKLFFSDKKRNMIMDGEFTKLIFSDELITLNGLYLKCPLYTQPVDKFQKKNMIWFQPYHVNNSSLIQNFCSLERELLEYYKYYTQTKKSASFILHNQLYSGNAKIYRPPSDDANDANVNHIIKISGVWESEDRFGVTYKFQGTQGTQGTYGSPNPSLC
jgi:hypothetical protein